MSLWSVHGVGGYSRRDCSCCRAKWTLVMTAQVWEGGVVVDTRSDRRHCRRRHLLRRPVLVDWRHEIRGRQLGDRSGRKLLRHRVGGWGQRRRWESRDIAHGRSLCHRSGGRGEDGRETRDGIHGRRGDSQARSRAGSRPCNPLCRLQLSLVVTATLAGTTTHRDLVAELRRGRVGQPRNGHVPIRLGLGSEDLRRG